MNWIALVPLGVAAGALSTVAGLGGGVLLVMTLSLWRDPQTALAISTPGLLLSNLHRFAIYRRHVDRKIAGTFVLGAFPGALAASLCAFAMPTLALRIVLVVVTLLALARSAGWWTWTPGPGSLAPAGLATGAIGASSGAGLLISPILISAGLRGDAFIATAAIVAVSIHVARILALGFGGRVTLESLQASAVLAIALVLGNFVGRWIRTRVGELTSDRLTNATLVLAVLVALAGLGR